MTDDLRQLSQRKPNFLHTLKAVLWGFLGVRKGSGYQDDIAQLNPVHLIIAGIVGGVIFVVVLLLIVKFAIASVS
jgi:hypothetical protein